MNTDENLSQKFLNNSTFMHSEPRVIFHHSKMFKQILNLNHFVQTSLKIVLAFLMTFLPCIQ